jgi:hypothetical protein
VLPLLEQHLTQARWRAFLHEERARRSPRERPEFLTWVVDNAGEQDAAAVLTKMPPPVRLVYRRVFRPRYDPTFIRLVRTSLGIVDLIHFPDHLKIDNSELLIT